MGQNDREIILYNISVDLEGERVLFHRLSLGSQKHMEKVSEVSEEI